MISKHRNLLLIITIIIFFLCLFSWLNINPSPNKNYDYYIIIDEIDNHSLMYVPLVVNIGDEILTEENKRYKVIKIEQNRAIVRFVEDVNLESYKKK